MAVWLSDAVDKFSRVQGETDRAPAFQSRAVIAWKRSGRRDADLARFREKEKGVGKGLGARIRRACKKIPSTFPTKLSSSLPIYLVNRFELGTVHTQMIPPISLTNNGDPRKKVVFL